MAKENIDEESIHTVSIIAGISFSIMTFAAFFASGFVYDNLIVSYDALTTARNIIESQSLFRAGLCGWLIIIVADVIVAWAFYLFFSCTDKKLSLLSSCLRFLYACILAIAVSCLTFVTILSDTNFARSMNTEQLYPQIMLFVNAFDAIWNWGLIIFGVHLLLTGIIAIRSNIVPTIMAIILIAASASYLIVNPAYMLLPRYSTTIEIIDKILKVPAMGEVAFGLWLFIRGGKKKYGKNFTAAIMKAGTIAF